MNSLFFPVSERDRLLSVETFFTAFWASIDTSQEEQFRIAIPSSFRPVNPNNRNSGAVRQLFRARDTANGDAEINVYVCLLAREVNAIDWIEIVWAEGNGTTVARRELFDGVDRRADVLMRHTGQGQSCLSRLITLKDGKRLFCIEGMVAEQIYPNIAGALFRSLTSFQILSPNGGLSVEPLVEARHTAVAPFRFLRPSSWDMGIAYSDENRVVVPLTSRRGNREDARIIVELRRRASGLRLESLAGNHAEHLKKSGSHLRGAPVFPITPPPGFQSAAFYAPVARYQEHEFDAPVLLLQHADALVALSLFGPSRQESPEWWAVNKRAFEIVRDSLVIGSSGTVAGEGPRQTGSSQTGGEEAAG